MKSLWRVDEELMKNWWRVDEELMMSWWRTDEELMKNWWRADEELMKNWWRIDEELMKSWWIIDDELMKSWWRTDDELMKSLWRADEEMMKSWWIDDEELMKSWWTDGPKQDWGVKKMTSQVSGGLTEMKSSHLMYRYPFLWPEWKFWIVYWICIQYRISFFWSQMTCTIWVHINSSAFRNQNWSQISVKDASLIFITKG